MPAIKKVYTVENLTEKIKQAQGLILSDYTGLNVAQVSQLRNEVKKAGGELEVVKNTLLGLASKNAQGKWSVDEKVIAGPTAALWIYKEDLAPLKILNDFIKKNELPKIKLGYWGQTQITLEKIKELAGLPGLSDLQAKVVGTLKAPLFRLSYSLNWNIQKLVLVLKAASGKSENAALKPKEVTSNGK